MQKFQLGAKVAYYSVSKRRVGTIIEYDMDDNTYGIKDSTSIVWWAHEKQIRALKPKLYEDTSSVDEETDIEPQQD